MDQNTIFYAWQSDTSNNQNRYFIRDALKKAISQLERDDSLDECPRLDHDTKDVPGTPAIADTIFEKIGNAKIFVADVTLIGKVGEKPVLNPNVAIELGYALRAVTSDRIILVMNTAFGSPHDLPFDLRHRRHPICYDLADGASPEDKTATKKNLANALAEAVRLILKIPEKKVPTKNLKVQINPTRNGKRQYAQIRLFNSGPGPIYIDCWWVQWGPEGRKGGTASGSTVKGKLPVRIEEQDAAELLVEIGDNLEELSGIGVFDGEHHLWLAENENLVSFREQAIRFRLPPLQEEVADPAPLKDCKVEIEVRSTPDNKKHPLEVRFVNRSEVPIPLAMAELVWTYTPPRKSELVPGRPAVEETGGSVRLSPQSRSNLVQPGEEFFFVLENDMSVFLLELVRGDVQDEDILVRVTTTVGARWTAKMEEVPATVRAAAQTVLKKAHESSR